MNKKIIMVDSLIGNDYTFCLGRGLKSAGADIVFIVPENKEVSDEFKGLVKKWAPAKDDSYGKLKKTYKYFIYLLKIFLYSLQRDNTVVHFQFFRRKGDAVLFYLMSILGRKLVYTAHNIMPHERNRSDEFFQNLVYKKAKSIIVHSSFIKDKLIRHFEVDDQNVAVIPHGNFDIYVPENRISQSEARKRLHLSQDENLILFFGYIREYKGLDLLFDAFELAKDCDPKLKLMVVGAPYNEDTRKKFLKRIEEIGKDRIFACLDFIASDKVHEYFEAADVVVLPYKNIDHSGIIHLAYSFCKPVIATNVGDFPETVENGKSGFIVPEKTPESLSDVILSALTDKQVLRKMGAYNRELNDTKYSWIDIGKKTMDIYRRM
jgi:glycosyltransferase involved in cell wall biosynthesis